MNAAAAASKLNTQRVSRINTLLNKMLANSANERSESSSSRTESIDRISQSAKKTETINKNSINNRPSVVNPNLKRNLFGVALNHDQLKQDLNSMWKEQIEIKKCQWNFDFETLKPIESNSDRFKWVQSNVIEQTSTKYISTLLNEVDNIDKENLNSTKTNDIPQFYKQQRCLKLIDNNAQVIKSEPEIIVKPKAVKSKTNKLQHGLNQIITFSENRKDTLRSASASSKLVKSTNSAFTKNEKKTDNLKQQSLLDMLKQRKKRIQTNSIQKTNDNNKTHQHVTTSSNTNPTPLSATTTYNSSITNQLSNKTTKV